MSEKKPKSFEKMRDNFAKAALRRASLRWPYRNEILKVARVERGLYKCAQCGEKFKRNQVEIDHIQPVVSLKSSKIDWNEYITQLYPPLEGFQVLCILCHEIKTKLEDNMRSFYFHNKS